MKKGVYIKRENIIPTFLILIVILTFFFPVKMNNLCKPNSPCPQSNTFIKITELKNPTLIGINYFYLVIEVIIAYILAAIIVHSYIKSK